jgi:hypothetical protein
MIILLFSAGYACLGEFLFEQGACVRATWTQEGIQLYPGLGDTWQTSGIQTLVSVDDQMGASETHRLGYQSTLLKAPEAELAFRNWALDAGNLFVDLPDRVIPHWETLCRLNLSPEERFVILRTMRTSTHRALEVWNAALEEVLASEKK